MKCVMEIYCELLKGETTLASSRHRWSWWDFGEVSIVIPTPLMVRS